MPARIRHPLRRRGGEESGPCPFVAISCRTVPDPGDGPLRPLRRSHGGTVAMMVTPAESLRSFGDRYRLLKLVGEGSSARVYVAEDLTLHRRVALKILKVEIADDTSFRDRFAAEMRATSLLNHPRVLPVYDWGLDPQPYSVTEYLTGGSLAMLLAAGHRLTPSQALVMGLEAARALVNIHAGGRAHLSLGPSAILFDSGARPYISDLGLSAALLPVAAGDSDGDDDAPEESEDVSPAAGETPDGDADDDGARPATEPEAGPDEQAAAAPSYSPLEQNQDVHDLALLLCEAVTGSRVLTSDEGDDASMTSLTALGPLQAVLARAAAVEPADRLSAADLAEELLRVANLLPRPEPIPLPSQYSPPSASAAASYDQTEDFAQVGPSVSERSAVPLDDAPRRRWPGIVLAAILVLGGAAAGVWALFLRGTDNPAVPELEGQTLGAATSVAADLGWQVNEILVREPGTSRGRVVRTEPPAGAPLDEGATLDLFVSLGEPLIPVSDLRFLYGMSLEEATDELEALGLDPSGETLVNDAVVPPGLVVGLDVEQGVYELEVGAEVNLLVSDGPSEAG
ncbi:MAG: PASTA domain-containing protein [Acidimicrobiaceae bacterium]|nr:PASTA domain-containing protein [Acidimicrobiaceae bacterium]